MCNVLEKNYVIDVWQGPEYTFEFARMIFACQYIPRMSKIPKFLPFLPHCSLYLLVGSSIMLPVFSFSISLPWSLLLDFPSPLPFWLLFSISLTHSYHLFSCLASCLLKLSSYLGCFFFLVLIRTYPVLFLRSASYLTSCLISSHPQSCFLLSLLPCLFCPDLPLLYLMSSSISLYTLLGIFPFYVTIITKHEMVIKLFSQMNGIKDTLNLPWAYSLRPPVFCG